MNYISVIVAILSIGAACIALTGRGGVRLGFLVWIATLALGYRTLTLTEGFKLHPAVVAIVSLFLWLLLTASSRVRTVWCTPAWLWMLIPFWIWGWVLGLRNEALWPEMLSELQSFVLFFPLFIVTATVLAKPREWRTVVLMFYWTATFVAVMGLLEYFFPGVKGLFPGFISNTDAAVAEDGFARAPFSFWGHQAATFICALAIPFLIPILRWKISPVAGICAWAALLPLLGAIYLSGFRVLWLFVTLQFILWLLLQKRYASGVASAAAFVAGYAALPTATQLRIESFILALEGTPVDSSGADHLNRLSDAVQSIQDYPFGLGWTGSGWVHCDFVQIAANLGVVPGIIFAGAYLWTAIRLCRLVVRRGNLERPLHLALLLSFLTGGGIMSTQVIFVLPQLACPVWFVWALTEAALRQWSLDKESSRNVRANIRITPHVQLRELSPEYARVR